MVYFDGQFWVGLITGVMADGADGVGRIVFGAEPTNAQIVEWVAHRYGSAELLPMSCPTAPILPKGNPKRRLREVQRALDLPVVGTAAQRAFKEALQAHGRERATVSRDERLAAERLRYRQRVVQRKHKKRGK